MQLNKKIGLYHVGEHIYALKIKDNHIRAMLFLRPQEFYESPFVEIFRKQFKISKFIDLYKKKYNKNEFTYTDDWHGFNVPSDILEECMFNIPNSEINDYDKIMLLIISEIRKLEGDNKYYLLGVDELNNSLLEHEFAHAMYFTLSDYKKDMDNMNLKLDIIVRDIMCDCINDDYADYVVEDELQAYMSTGLVSKMEDLKIPNIKLWQKKYRTLFKKYYSKKLFKKPIKVRLSLGSEKPMLVVG